MAIRKCLQFVFFVLNRIASAKDTVRSFVREN